MEHEAWRWLSYRSMMDIIIWVMVMAIFLLYFWALVAGSVSALEPEIRTAPERSQTPIPRPLGPKIPAPALV